MTTEVSLGTIQIDLPMAQIADFCQRWKITEFALFGSVLRNDFRPDSDIDVLVQFAPDSQRSLHDLTKMQEEIEAIIGRKVDLVNRKSVEQSENYIRRKAMLKSLQGISVPRDPANLLDMLLAAQEAQSFVQDCDQARFKQDRRCQNALEYALELVGRAAGRVSDEFKANRPDIQWAKFFDLATSLLEQFDNVDLDEVWNVVQNDIPILIAQIEPLVPPDESDKQQEQ